ncbi:MAG: alpha/beta hydrolase [Azoarcus sp.]|nr:alpha/beta hydrolase [Azoarcus sp.]
MKLRHTKLSIPARDAWLIARMAHAPNVRGLILILQTCALPHHGHKLETPMALALQKAGYATLALNLLTREEWDDTDTHYNIAELSERALAVLEWVRYQPRLAVLPLGVLASHTAAAAAIRAAARLPERIAALGIFAGRPDLAGAAPLRSLKTPTCFIIGEDDPRTEILRQAFDLITAVREWRTGSGGDPEQMNAVMLAACADIVADWMRAHLPSPVEEDDGPLFPPLASALFFADTTPSPHPSEK